MSAICHCCGTEKKRPLVTCSECGVLPTGNERAFAWLLSTEYLSELELKQAGLRIVEGEALRPSRSLQRMAMRRMGFVVPAEVFHLKALGLLVFANLVLTPLLGLALWWGYGLDQPIKARQSLMSSGLALTISILFTLIGLKWMG